MLQVLACVTQDHSPWLVLLAAAICGFGAWVSFSLVVRAATAPARSRPAWLGAAAISTGGGIWATHFIAMLAYRTGLPIGYDLWLTALSIAIAVAGSAVGIAVAVSGGRWGRVAGGGLVGVVIGAMHFTGMAALRAPADLTYDPRYVAASLAIGVVLGAGAMAYTLERPTLRRRLAGTVLLAAAICGLHFTGMTAAALVPNPLAAPTAELLAPEWLAAAVAVITTVILVLSLAGSVVDQRLAAQSARETIRLRTSEERFRQLADATSEGIIIHRNGVILDANRAFASLLGHPQEHFIGRSVLEFVAPDHHVEIRHRVANPAFGAMEIEILDATGATIAVECNGQPITHEGSPARVVAIRDLRERRQAEERIRHMATHDALTGLPNRDLFRDRFDVALGNAGRQGQCAAVLYLDLDRFRSVNDLLGHHAGDRLLQQVARRLAERVRRHDTVARLSGDEFVILQAPIATPGEAMALAESVAAALADPFDLGDQRMEMGTSIGIALFPQDGTDPEQLLANAGTALGRAKAVRRGTFQFYEAAMDAHLQARRRLELDLRQALATESLGVHYQPLLACDTHAVCGFEALVRWPHPEHGMIPPSDFIPLAEETGLILPLGDWVLRTACRAARSWPDHVHVAVNLSPVQFRGPDVAASILAILDEVGLPPHRLEVEITEGVLIDDTERALTTLRALTAAGVRVALDDFGTGYSSLSYLQRFSFDKLKIDRSFVGGMEAGRESLSIIRTILALARSLGITVTAEGVETPAQFQMLKDEACDQVQGYLIGRPAPVPSLVASLPATVAVTDAATLAVPVAQ